MKGPDKTKCTSAIENEIGCLFRRIQDIEGTDICLFIYKHEVPKDRKITYSHIVCNIRTQKKETHRLLLTVGGNKLSYNGPVSTPTVYLTTDKLHWNRFFSTPDGKYLIVDVKNFYLKNPMNKAEYYKIALKLIPQEIIDKYDLINKKIYGYIYVRVEKGLYGLVQSGIISG